MTREEEARKFVLASVSVNALTGCWCWHEPRPDGYKTVWFDGRNIYVHRLSYLAFVGEIPDGLHIDHLCWRRNCVNPEHLEPVTQIENTIRAMRSRPTNTCHLGHPLSGENLKVRPNGWRVCLECARRHARESRARRRAEREGVQQ